MAVEQKISPNGSMEPAIERRNIMKRVPIANVVMLVVGLGLPFIAGHRQAIAEDLTAVCSFTVDGAVSPGLSMTEASGSWKAAGPIDCVGSVDGQQVTGTGVIVESGPLSGTCARGSGSGTQSITIPTAGGEVHVTQPITFDWVGAGGPFQRPRLSGVFEFRPTHGDCVNQPLTGYAQVTQAVLRSS